MEGAVRRELQGVIAVTTVVVVDNPFMERDPGGTALDVKVQVTITVRWGSGTSANLPNR